MFKVGDQVIRTGTGGPGKGAIGTIVSVFAHSYGVCWEGFKDPDTSHPPGWGWGPQDMKLYEPPTIAPSRVDDLERRVTLIEHTLASPTATVPCADAGAPTPPYGLKVGDIVRLIKRCEDGGPKIGTFGILRDVGLGSNLVEYFERFPDSWSSCGWKWYTPVRNLEFIIHA